MTATGPDGFQLGSSDNAVAELNVNALRSLVVLVEVLQVVTAGDVILLGRDCVQQAALHGNGNRVAVVLHCEGLGLLLHLVLLENGLNEDIAGLTVVHPVVRNQDACRGNAGDIRLQVVAILNTEVLCQADTQNIGVVDLAGSAAAVFGEHGAGRVLVHFHIDDGGRCAKSLIMLTHHDVLQRNLLLFSHRHGLCKRAIDTVVDILIALLGCDEPRILVARCNEDEVVQANAVDTQRALISVFGAKLKTFRKLFFRHAIAPIRDNHCIQVLGSCLFDGNQDVDWACAVGQSVVNGFASRIAHG